MEQKKALLVVSFGTSYPETRAKTIERLEAALQAAFPERQLFRAWTSKMIIARVGQEQGLHVDTVTEAMARLRAEGFTDVLVQPTHILPGVENDLMLADIKAQAEGFAQITVGQPLLAEADDMFETVDIVAKELDGQPDCALVVMGHGTSHQINPVYAALDYMFKDAGHANIFVGTVEAYPSLDNVLRMLAKTPYRRVRLAPLMIVAGDHATNDMAGDEPDSWKCRLQEAGYQVECLVRGLGELQRIADIFVAHAKAAKPII